MPAIEEVCTMTTRGRTTEPKAIRQALGVGYGGQTAFRVRDGDVCVHAVAEQEADLALGPFLALIERDIAARPEGLVPLAPALATRLMAATEGVAVDPDLPIGGEAAL